jgi:hypothetical protein
VTERWGMEGVPPSTVQIAAGAGDGLLRAISNHVPRGNLGRPDSPKGYGKSLRKLCGKQPCRVMADPGRPPIVGQSIDGRWEAPARCYADFRGLSGRRASTCAPACVSAPSETFPRLAHRRMASATSALVSCCSPSGVFLQTRSNATSIFARVRISKLLSIMALAHSRPDRWAIVREHLHVAQAARPGRAVDNVQHSTIFSIRNRTFTLQKARSLIFFMSSLQPQQ